MEHLSTTFRHFATSVATGTVVLDWLDWLPPFISLAATFASLIWFVILIKDRVRKGPPK